MGGAEQAAGGSAAGKGTRAALGQPEAGSTTAMPTVVARTDQLASAADQFTECLLTTPRYRSRDRRTRIPPITGMLGGFIPSAGPADSGPLGRRDSARACKSSSWTHPGGRVAPANPHVDAPDSPSTLTDQEFITVIDPTHPLYGRRFHVLWLCRSAHGEGFVEVCYREHIRLRLPLSATDRTLLPPARPGTKLTLEAIHQLIARVKECHALCPSSPTVSGPGSPTT